MRLFLTAKHWQIFIVLLIGLLLGNFTVVGHPEISVAVRVTGFLITFAWQLSIGHGLYQFLPAKVEVKYNLFIINWFVVMVVICAASIYSDGEGMTFTGVAALPGLYVVYAFLHMLIFPAKLLTSVEMRKEAHFGDYFVTFLLMILWPVGVWFIQPRLNEVVIQAGAEN
jgi:peptidoglycan/LPS O-acetylase OafA/YrhL